MKAAAEARVIVAFKPDAALMRQTLSARAPAQGRAERPSTRAGVALIGRPQPDAELAGASSRRAGAGQRRAGGAGWPPTPTSNGPCPTSAGAALRGAERPALCRAPAAAAGPDQRPVVPARRRPPPTARRPISRPPGTASPASPAMVIAVLDTGVRPDHPDLNGVLLPGIDAINDVETANDGDGVDADARDPGDWITAAEDSQRGGPLRRLRRGRQFLARHAGLDRRHRRRQRRHRHGRRGAWHALAAGPRAGQMRRLRLRHRRRHAAGPPAWSHWPGASTAPRRGC